MTTHESFYENLDTYNQQKDWFVLENFVRFDANWYLIAVDIKGSTKAIEQGRYKDVNMAGALSIIALLNETQTHELPFVFGGDGAIVLVPDSLATRAAEVLAGCAYVVQRSFDLELRTGIIKLETLYKRGESLSVIKYQTSPSFKQAIFQGSALDTFENGIKSALFETIEPKETRIDLSGLECRWKDIDAPKDVTLSLLVDARVDKIELYPQLLEMIEQILGDTQARNALSKDNLVTSKSITNLQTEVKVKSVSPLLSLRFLLENIMGSVLMYFKIKTSKINWSRYKDDVIHATDAEKFDGGLKMVVTASLLQLETLRKYLEKLHQEEKLYYGIHTSSRALMTCLVYERNGAQVHFIDAADGGYAMAAKHLKAQKKRG